MKMLKKLILTLLLICNTVYAASAETISERYDTLESNLSKSERICALLEEYNIPCDYEKLDIEIIKRYIEYGREDISEGKSSRAEYTVDILEELNEKAQKSLGEILNGEKEQISVPKFKSGKLSVDGVNHIGTVDGGKSETQPVFLNGYGHFFSEISSELPNFSDIGVNFVQIPVPPSSLVLRPDYFAPGWQFEKSGSTAVRVSDIRKNGQKGGLIAGASGGSGRIYQTVSTVSGKEYSFSVWIKTHNIQKAQIRLGSETVLEEITAGTVDWSLYSVTFTAVSDSSEIGIYTEGAGSLWADSMTLCPQGDVNCLENEGFEETATRYNGYLVSDAAVKTRVTDILQCAQDNNVMVTLNLEPHNMPDWLTDPAQPGYDGGALSAGQVGFLRYNIGNDTYRNVLKSAIQAIAEASKGFTSLHSVTLSNEGLYRIRNNTSTFIAGYRTWLKDKYGTVDNLRKAWGRDDVSFESITYFPSEVTTDTPESMDYNAYNAEVFMSWHEWMRDEFKAVNPDIKTHAKFLSGYMLANRLGDGIDYERIAESLDYIGFDGGTSLDNLNTNMRLMEDILSSCSEGKPLVNSEVHTISDTGGSSEYYGAEQSAVTKLELVQGYIHGRTAAAMWVWRRHYQWADYLNSIAFRADAVRDLGKATHDINRNADRLTALQNAEKNIYIVWSPIAQRYNNGYIDCLTKAYNAALSIGQRVSFVTEKQLAREKLTGNEILILTNASHLLGESYEHLEKFTEHGGKIISIGENLKYDEYLNDADGADILKNAVNIPSDALESAVAASMSELLEEKEKTLVFPADADGNTVDGLETRFAETEDGLLVNLANYTRSEAKIVLYSNKYNLKYAEDIFTGETIDTSNMTFAQLETRVLFFPKERINCEYAILPGDSSVKLTWKPCPDNPLNPKEKIMVKVNGSLKAETDFNDFSCDIEGLDNSEIYMLEISALYSDGATGETEVFFTSPHRSEDEIVLDFKENNGYILTNTAEKEKSITVEAVYDNGDKTVLHFRLKAGEATEFNLLSGADVAVKTGC